MVFLQQTGKTINIMFKCEMCQEIYSIHLASKFRAEDVLKYGKLLLMCEMCRALDKGENLLRQSL